MGYSLSATPPPARCHKIAFFGGQIVKFFDAEPTGPARYAPLQVTHWSGLSSQVVPIRFIFQRAWFERQNLTMRMSMRRFTRLTNAFSKKLENLQAAVSLHFAHFNNVRIHKSLRMTPAMAANVNDRL